MKNMIGGMALGSALAGVAANALLRAPKDVRLEHVRLPVPGLPESSRPLEILFLTDAHHWEWGIREERALALVKDLPKPDLVVWGGDYLGVASGASTAVGFIEAVLARFPGVPSVAVRGNAEHKILPEQRAALEHAIEASGARVLVNQHCRLHLAGNEWVVAGTDDPYYGFCDLEATLSGVGESELTLLVAHSPQLVCRAGTLGVDVQLSGHTHGGQVRVPGFGALRTQNPLSRRIDCGAFDRDRLAHLLGEDVAGNLSLYVSRGLGVAFVPRMPWLAPRLFCPPEITWLTLYRPDGSVPVSGSR